jgi:rsbT co-antagonist protein RsbR
MSLNVELSGIINKHVGTICNKWIELLEKQVPITLDLFRKEDLNDKGKEIIESLSFGLKQNTDSLEHPSYNTTKSILKELSRELTMKNVTPTETALLVFNLKEALLPSINAEVGKSQEKLVESIFIINRIIDNLGLFTIENHILIKESIIKEQANAILEMSTPVVKIWDKIILLPLVGVLDSTRAKQMMESLLEAIENNQAKVAILDISGIPVIDTLVARHLFTTIAAVKLMGAECIVTGISARISQTIVHLGLDLSGIITRSNLADGLQLALVSTSQSMSLK